MLLLWVCCPALTLAADYLFADGHSDYAIVVAADASASERTAASELQTYLHEVGGVRLPLMGKAAAGGKHIFVGWQSALGIPRPDAADDGYTYRTIGSDLYIYGGRERGSMYGVYAFLERELGVRWLTSSCTHVERKRHYVLPRLSHTERPAFGHRLDFYYDALRHHDWCAHNLLNAQYSYAEGKYGPFRAYWGIHTFHTLVPPAEFFGQHPEYYSVKDGRRSDKAQLCLSNRGMRRVLTARLKEVIRSNPGYWCYDVSQNDNQYACECRACQQLARRYGGQSGAMLWFVNQVAKEVGKDFPGVLIGTFAYRYTRQAPTSSIRPADNVVVRLCNIECCFAHPLTGCEQNRDFLRDVDAWKKLTDKIYIWDYVTGFSNYLLPFPNIPVMAANLRYFHQSHVIGVMEEGAHDAPWNEFSELKQWVIAKLLWNPYQDADSLARLFISAYYGASAPMVQQYYDLCHSGVKSDVHFDIYLSWKNKLYDDAFVGSAGRLLDKALQRASDSETQRRVRRLQAQISYLKVRRNPVLSRTDGTFTQLKGILQTDSTIVKEFGYTLDKLAKDLSYY